MKRYRVFGCLMDRLVEVENRWQGDMNAVKQSNKELINELKQRHDRDLDAMGLRVSEQIKSVEVNVLARLQLFIDAVNRNATRTIP